MAEVQNRLDMLGIKKQFGSLKALDGVDLRVLPGEVHALVGENGAGKSTLMKVLSGAYSMDAGEVYLDGVQMENITPRKAIDAGIAVIYQEFMQAPDLTVAENIFIDKLGGDRRFINWRELRQRAKEQLAHLGFEDINPNTKVGNLSVAYQQVVEISKCLARKAKVLVLDEPTAVLTFSEIEKLFDIIRKLKDEGVSIIYISHRLEEVFLLSDRITVLKDGKNVDTVETGSIDKHKLVTMMVGRELNQMFPERHAEIGDVVLEVKNLRALPVVRDVSFSVRAGEVVGFSGLVGAGRTETMRAIFGADPRTSGEVLYFGKAVAFKHPQEAVKSRLGLLPEDRKKQGLILDKSIRINTTLATIGKMTTKGVFHHAKERQYVKELLDRISTKYGSTEDKADSLSGGNQQKVALAKWIAADCKCIIFDEPTRGVDVGAKTEIYKIINELAENGVAVVVISSEMLEVIGFCDRALVMRRGRIVGEVAGEGMTEEKLIKLAMGVV